MWYGYVGPRLNGVTQDYSYIEHVVKLVPYATFRSYRNEDEAWSFVHSRKHNYIIYGINKYGDIFETLHLGIEYFITDEGIYSNFKTDLLGFVAIPKPADDVQLEYKTGLIKVHIPMKNVHESLLTSHATAIYVLLSLAGPLVDVNVMLPDFSVFYMLTQYTGNKIQFTRTLNLIKRRTGNTAFTIKRRDYL